MNRSPSVHSQTSPMPEPSRATPPLCMSATGYNSIANLPSSHPPATIAEAGGCESAPGQCRVPNGLWLVDGIEPYKGYYLLEGQDQDSDGFYFPVWCATGPDGEHTCHVSRFKFTPTQERFNWLVDWGFPYAVDLGLSMGGPLTNAMIDGVLLGEATIERAANLRKLVAGHGAFNRSFGRAGL